MTETNILLWCNVMIIIIIIGIFANTGDGAAYCGRHRVRSYTSWLGFPLGGCCDLGQKNNQRMKPSAASCAFSVSRGAPRSHVRNRALKIRSESTTRSLCCLEICRVLYIMQDSTSLFRTASTTLACASLRKYSDSAIFARICGDDVTMWMNGYDWVSLQKRWDGPIKLQTSSSTSPMSPDNEILTLRKNSRIESL